MLDYLVMLLLNLFSKVSDFSFFSLFFFFSFIISLLGLKLVLDVVFILNEVLDEYKKQNASLLQVVFNLCSGGESV